MYVAKATSLGFVRQQSRLEKRQPSETGLPTIVLSLKRCFLMVLKLHLTSSDSSGITIRLMTSTLNV